MTIMEAIEDLERRKKMLQSSCATCWDPAVEMALQALKEKANMNLEPLVHCENCLYADFSNLTTLDMGRCTQFGTGKLIFPDDFCSDGREFIHE